MKQKTLGTCITEYTIDNYDEAISKYTSFVAFSQFDSQVPSFVHENMKVLHTPKVSIGEKLYGIEKDGSLTFLKSVIDSGG